MKEYNLKNIRQDFKEKGIFYTDRELALYLKSFLPDDAKEIYDPTCGNGSLLSVFGDDVEKYGQDINADQLQVAAGRLKNFHWAEGDTLTNPAFTGKKFRHIIANPPFSIKWTQNRDKRFEMLPAIPPSNRADYAFLAHILYCLADDGVAVVLNSPGILFRKGAEGTIRQWMVCQNYIDVVIAVDGGHFVDTKIATCILILKKHRDTTSIRFAHNDKEIVVPREHIEKNAYDLTVSKYIVEKKKEAGETDTSLGELFLGMRKSISEQLRAALELERMLGKLAEIETKAFTEEIKEILRQYEI